MTTTRSDPGGSWWWPPGGGGAVEGQPAEGTFVATENELRRCRELAALGGYQLQEAPRETADTGVYQLSYPRPRLRWTAELHDQFVKAVDDLGGANKATPKAILNLMGVQGLTLYHLKSHLQKFRLGKTGRKLWKKDLIPPTYFRKRDDRLPPMNLEAQGPSISNAFNMNGTNVLGAEAYGNMHLLAEPPAASENFEAPAKIPTLIANEAAGAASAAAAIGGGVKLEEESGAVQPPLLPLFPACGMMEWSEYLDGGGLGRRSAENASTMDDYLSYTSSELAHHSRIIFKSFFDEVATFSAAGADNPTADYP